MYVVGRGGRVQAGRSKGPNDEGTRSHGWVDVMARTDPTDDVSASLAASPCPWPNMPMPLSITFAWYKKKVGKTEKESEKTEKRKGKERKLSVSLTHSLTHFHARTHSPR